MDRGAPTGYTPVPLTAYPPTTVDIDGYQPAAPSHPQVAAQPPPPAYAPPSQGYPGQGYPGQGYAYPPPAQQQTTTNVAVVTAGAPTNHIIVAQLKPPNYLGLSLLNLLCLCFPIGLIALICSIRVDSEYSAGNLEEAKQASDAARTLNFIGIGFGIFLVIAYVIAIAVGVATS